MTNHNNIPVSNGVYETIKRVKNAAGATNDEFLAFMLDKQGLTNIDEEGAFKYGLSIRAKMQVWKKARGGK